MHNCPKSGIMKNGRVIMLGIKDKDTKFQKEILSALVIAMALIPEAIAFSFMLGVSPLVGIYTSILLTLITAIFGGRAAMITATTGAIAAIFAPMVADYGVSYLIYAVVLMGLFQVILGLFNIDKIFHLISKATLLGAVNGLAFIMLMAQLEQLKVPGTEEWIRGIDLGVMLVVIVCTIFITIYTPKQIKKYIPASLLGIAFATFIAVILETQGYHMYTVYDMASSNTVAAETTRAILNIETLKIILIPAFSAAIVGIIESLLTLTIIDDATITRGNAKKECVSLGFANIICGLTGGMGGCAVLGQSMINIENGARKYLSTFMAGIILLLIVLVFSPILKIIPTAGIVGVMMIVIYKTFNFDSLFIHRKANLFEFIIVITVTIVTAISGNLALGVIIGAVMTMSKFTWDKSKKYELYREGDTIHITGIIFFGNATKLRRELENKKINSIQQIDLKNCRILDYTGADQINIFINNARNFNREIKFINVCEESMIRLTRVSPEEFSKLCEEKQ